MSDAITLSVTTVNAPDALALATFYAQLTGGVTKGSAPIPRASALRVM